MVLVRIAYAADLPTPDEAIRSLGDNRAATAPRWPAGRAVITDVLDIIPAWRGAAFVRLAARRHARGACRRCPLNCRSSGADGAQRRETSRRVALQSFEELIALAAEKRDIGVKAALERDVRLVRFEDGRLEFALEAKAQKSLTGDFERKSPTGPDGAGW